MAKEVPGKVLALIPAFNEEKSVGKVIDEVRKHQRDYLDEIVVVDDSSTDKTKEIVQDKGVEVVSHVINIGVGGAVRTGYRYAIQEEFDYLVLLDADGQHDPKYIPKLFNKLIEDECDLVIGSRFLNESHKGYSYVRKAGIIFFTKMVSFLGGIDITDVTSGYRVYDVDALKKLDRNKDDHWAIEQSLEASRRNLKIEECSVEMPIREEGKSQFDLETFFWYPIRMIDVLLRVIIFR
ncbi:glycosyltransferase family 2 protein [archaeon SCG-AAA382B04]|nr:glycosyltransferase family 2 protein [archaeon SCG-AAA382B04]